MTPEETRKGIKFVQVIDGAITTVYTPKELVFSVMTPRTDLRAWGYGYSPLEMLIRTITAHLYAEKWNQTQFTHGSTTKGILNIKGNIPPQQLEAFKRAWLTQVSGVNNSWRTPVINSNDDIQWISLQPNNNDMGFEQWLNYLTKMVCAIYLIDPAEINFDTRGGGMAQKPMFMGNNEAQQKVSQDKGLRPLLRHIERHINKAIVERMNSEFIFEFVGIDAKTEAEAIDLRLKELQSYMTINEVREREQLAPVPHGDVIPNPSYIGFRSQKEMAEAQGGGQPGGQPGQGQQPGQEAPKPEEKKAEPKKTPDRFYLPDEDWEETLTASMKDDLKKSTEPLNDLLSDIDNW
jgi:hypothetical protein